MSFSDDFPHHRSGEAAYYLISLIGCQAGDILHCLQWLQSMSYRLSFPALLLVDELSPWIQQQTAGTNTVVIGGKMALGKMQEILHAWLIGMLEPQDTCRTDMQLNANEWGALNRYLLLQDMPTVAKLMRLPLKKAYYWRKRALSKLGFRHLNDFLRHYPVGKPRTTQML